MLTPLAGLDRGLLLKNLATFYGVHGFGLEFIPLGEDSWAYRSGPLWISVRRDLRGHFPAAYLAAHQLHESGLDYVLAPIPGNDGLVVHQIGTYPMVVFPYLDGIAPAQPSDAGAVMDMIRGVHSSPVSVHGLPAEDFQLTFSADLDAATAFAYDGSADTGPYSARLQRLLRTHEKALAAMRRDVAQAGDVCRATAELVLTHGEPSAANVLRYRGGLLLADWSGAAWGPPERDWCAVIRTMPAAPPCRPQFLKFYELRWILSEIAEYATIFAAPHDGSADDHAMWQRLMRYLPEAEHS